MDQIDVPCHFLCPISLQLMRDPVTVSTGITYDREDIEKWLFSLKNKTCPVTKQELITKDLTPNHNLRRLIQAWCTLNASFGIERIPTPKPLIDRAQIAKLLSDAKKSPHLQLKSLRRLRSITLESERNRSCLEEAGVVDFLVSILKADNSTSAEIYSDGDESEFTRASDEALNILYHLKISQRQLKNLVINDGDRFLESLLQIMKHSSYQSRAYATMLFKSVFEVADPMHLMSIRPEMFVEIVRVLDDQISQQASKAALKLLVEICPWGRNRIKAVEGGAVSVLIELLLDASDKRACELILAVLELLCGCADGRAEFSATSGVLQEMLQVGVVAKLCLVMQVNSNLKTKDRAREILKLHAKIWRNSVCIPANLMSSYPSS
ncbi:hypothetical protein OIU76_020712 [Salix suchowensis]|nr:hypothetical protein OIU76_020712 [Salix suchowensis]